MMEINKELILRVAKNARLNLKEDEVKQFTKDFNDILNAFSELDKVNTNNVKPSFQPIEFKNKLREDKVKECVSQDLILRNSHHKKEGYFLGPKAL